MILLSLILVLAFVQWWGSGGPVQWDGWFDRWAALLERPAFLLRFPALRLVLTVLVPTLALAALVCAVVYWLSANWLFFVYVPVLLYSLGRGDFTAQVKAYLAAAREEDWPEAQECWQELRSAAAPEATEPGTSWTEMNNSALSAVSYRGFERMFAVLFWFFVLGAPGALLYRLSVLYRARQENAPAQRWLHLLEWPAVRVLALTWALAGNFDHCFHHWRRALFSWQRSSAEVLHQCLRGALGADRPERHDVDDEGEDAIPGSEPAYSRRLVAASLPLLSRALLLWVCALAVVILLL